MTAKVVPVPVWSIEELDRVAELTERINPLSARFDQVRRRYLLTPATLDERLEAHVQQVDQQHNGEDDGGDDRYPVQDDVDGVGEHGRQDERDQ
jgi:hypothetical protein